MHNAVFNTYRRTKGQILYVLPPLIAAYAALNWAVERYATTFFCPLAYVCRRGVLITMRVETSI